MDSGVPPTPSIDDPMQVPARSTFSLLACVLFAPSAAAQWTTATLSVPRTVLAAETVGRKALFAGGYVPSFGASDVVDIYDDGTGQWSTALLSSPGAGCAARVGSKVFFAGGICAGPACTGGPSGVVDIYDDSSGAWSTANLSSVRGDLDAVAVGTQVLFAGGLTVQDQQGLDTVDIYDDATGVWSTATLSVGRFDMAVVSVGSKAIFAGGGLMAGPYVPTDVVDIYDAATGTWSTATLSAPLANGVATSVGSRAYFSGNGASVVDVYDDTTGTWFTMPAPNSHRAGAATSNGAQALFAGGFSSGVHDVSVFDSAANTWSTYALSVYRDHLAATTVGAKSFFAGGQFFGGFGGVMVYDTVDIYDDALGAAYCSPGVANSTGAPARITAQGFPGAAAQGYVILTADRLPTQSVGYFLTSQMQGFAAGPGGSQGDLCLGGAVGRFAAAGQLQNSGASGTFELTTDLTQHPQPTGLVSVQAGETWNFQAWYRDANPGPTSNFTDAVSVTLQ